MLAIGFYHCTRSAPHEVLPKLAQKALDSGHKVAVHCRDAEALTAIDRHLWTFDPGSFLPHGTEPAEAPPILLSNEFRFDNGADLLICLGGQLPGEMSGLARILYVFDGGEDGEVETARQHWRALSAREEVTPVYWTQNERGGWQKA